MSELLSTSTGRITVANGGATLIAVALSAFFHSYEATNVIVAITIPLAIMIGIYAVGLAVAEGHLELGAGLIIGYPFLGMLAMVGFFFVHGPAAGFLVGLIGLGAVGMALIPRHKEDAVRHSTPAAQH